MKIMELLRKKDVPDSQKNAFEQRCSELTERLNDIRAAFDYAVDAQAIDALIYEENAVLCMLEQLFKDARAEGISLQMHERRKNRYRN